MAKRLGYEVLNYIVKDDPIEVHNTNYPDGPPLTVSYFPTGVKGGDFAGTDYIKDYKGNPAYKIWQKYISRVAKTTGYKFLDFLGADLSIDSSKKEELKPTTLREQALTKKWWSEQFNLITEAKANTHLDRDWET